MRAVKSALHVISVTAVFVATASPVWAQTRVQVVLLDGRIQPASMTATERQPLHIDVVNRGLKVHNFVIPDFYVFTSNLNPGERTSIEFRPTKAGSFRYYSDKNGVPEKGMEGTLKVQP